MGISWFWYVKVYFKLLFGKEVWCSWFTWLFVALGIYYTATSEDKITQGIRSVACLAGVLMFLTFVGMLMGIVKYKLEKKQMP